MVTIPTYGSHLGTAKDATGGTGATFPITVPAHTNGYLFVPCSAREAFESNVVSSIKYQSTGGGTLWSHNLTFINTAGFEEGTSGGVVIEGWGLVNPRVDSGEIVVTLNGTWNDYLFSAHIFENVNQATPTGTVSSGVSGGASDPQIAASTANNSSLATGIMTFRGGIADPIPNTGSPIIQQFEDFSGTSTTADILQWLGTEERAIAGAWTFDVLENVMNDNWAALVIEFLGTEDGGPDPDPTGNPFWYYQMLSRRKAA